ncbi:MAG TPA: sigma 54-interacting transcriptional regulator [Vicinamibacterales bacterium]|nr:sigma 54-interacting transcriptional regulator [Vicinamibacterales bacterium]
MNAPELLAPKSHTRRNPGPDTVNGWPDDLDLAWAAQVDVSILFTGSADAVKLARRIHAVSGWRWGPFLMVDCAWPAPTLDQRLFDVLRPNSEAVAAGELQLRLLQPGTIFLHEVGKLGRPLQVRLADALASSSLAGERRRPRYRIMASTSESLLHRVAAGTFDDHLFYRLNMLHVVLPPDDRD